MLCVWRLSRRQPPPAASRRRKPPPQPAKIPKYSNVSQLTTTNIMANLSLFLFFKQVARLVFSPPRLDCFAGFSCSPKSTVPFAEGARTRQGDGGGKGKKKKKKKKNKDTTAHSERLADTIILLQSNANLLPNVLVVAKASKKNNMTKKNVRAPLWTHRPPRAAARRPPPAATGRRSSMEALPKARDQKKNSFHLGPDDGSWNCWGVVLVASPAVGSC